MCKSSTKRNTIVRASLIRAVVMSVSHEVYNLDHDSCEKAIFVQYQVWKAIRGFFLVIVLWTLEASTVQRMFLLPSTSTSIMCMTNPFLFLILLAGLLPRVVVIQLFVICLNAQKEVQPIKPKFIGYLSSQYLSKIHAKKCP